MRGVDDEQPADERRDHGLRRRIQGGPEQGGRDGGPGEDPGADREQRRLTETPGDVPREMREPRPDVTLAEAQVWSPAFEGTENERSTFRPWRVCDPVR